MKYTALSAVAVVTITLSSLSSAWCVGDEAFEDCTLDETTRSNAVDQEIPHPVVVKKREDHIVIESPFCGQLVVVSTPKDNPHVDVAVAINIRPTKAHFHKHFQEIYMVLDGTLTLELYDPNTERVSKVTLEANELAMIPPGVHHRISEASAQNRLQVMCLPGFNAEDEHASDKI